MERGNRRLLVGSNRCLYLFNKPPVDNYVTILIN
jgi:hypothetical protein